MKKFLNFLFWLVIAAAFIGPGTVTTAASAGASYQYQLVWAMVFSTMACLVLQEAAARIVIVSGKSLGEAIRLQFSKNGLVWSIAIAIFLGCMAYEAGNILGALSGVGLIFGDIKPWMFITLVGLVSFVCLWFGKTQQVANFLGLVVAVMGLSFMVAAFASGIDFSSFMKGAFVPSLPQGSLMISLGLIGTTIVPYNIFLGSSMAEGQNLREMRSGLSLSVILGGLISICVILVGAKLDQAFSFKALYIFIGDQQGEWFARLFAIGLFAAGFTSTITASLAGALTIKSIHPKGKEWTEKHTAYRFLWILTLFFGLGIGLLNVKVIPVIIAAQAANGLILPILTFSIWLMVNNIRILRKETNGLVTNILMGITLVVSTFLGLINVSKALFRSLGQSFEMNSQLLIILSVLTLLFLIYTLLKLKRSQG